MNPKKDRPPSVYKDVVTSKAVSDNNNRDSVDISNLNFLKITKNTEEILRSNESIIDLFPDIELSMQILASSILSPKDLTTTSLIYSINETPLSNACSNTLLETIKKHIKSKYKLEDKLYDIIIDALFKSGSHMEAIIPEASVDAIINDGGPILSVEDYVDNVAKLSKGSVFINDSNVESTDIIIPSDVTYLDNLGVANDILVKINKYIEGTENMTLLKAKSEYRTDLNKDIRRNLTTESYDSQLAHNMESKLKDIFKPVPVHNNSTVVHVNTVDENTRGSVGSPLLMKLPIESVIPVYVPGEPNNHLGYFILLDNYGLPLRKSEKWEETEDSKLEKLMDGGISSKAKKELDTMTKETPVLEDMHTLAGVLLDARIGKLITGNKLNGISEIGDLSDIYKLMMSRVLSKQRTRILYLPSEVVANYTFNYKSNGLGESMLEKIGVLASMRAVLLFSRLMGDVKNSITNTVVKSKLEDDDPDPEGTMDRIMAAALKTRQNLLPLGIKNMGDLADWSTKAGMSFQFQHPDLPDMTIETEEVTTDIKEPEGRLDDRIEKQIIQSFGLTPEMVDNGFSPDFATSIVANNALLNKRVQQYQNKLVPMITRHVRMIVRNDMIINNVLHTQVLNDIKNIKKNLSKDKQEELKVMEISDETLSTWILDTVIDEIVVSIPSPDNHEQDALKESYDQYKSSIEEYIEAFISEDALPESLAGELTGTIDEFKTAASSTLLRKWMTENNYLPELQRILDIDKDGKPNLDVLEDYNVYISNLSKSLKTFKKSNDKIKSKLDKTLSDQVDEDTSPSTDNADT